MNILGGQHEVQYGTTRITFELIYTRRTTLGIQVYPDGSVTVRAPEGASLAAIEAIVLKRAPWILRQQRQFQGYQRQPALPRRYVSGEAYRYLGQQRRLKVIQGTVEHVELSRDFLAVYIHDTGDRPRIAQLIEAWYITRAQRLFAERLSVCFPRVASWGVGYPELAIRMMKTRWGSCRGNGKITLNLRLMQVATDLIDYVILHELCHLKEANHSPAFYALLDHILPDWREKRKRLNSSEIL